MGIFDRFKASPIQEERSSTNFSYGSNANLSITSFFGGEVKMTEEQAMKIPTVATSIELITSSIAQLPIHLYQEKPDGEVERMDDERIFLLNNEPNTLMNGHNFKKSLVKDYLFYGASYTKVDRVRNDVIAMHHLPIEALTITRFRKLGYQYDALLKLNIGEALAEFTPEELVMVLRDSKDGVTSTGILENGADILSLALDEQDYTQGILKNGALPIGILKASSRLTETAINRLRSSWEGLYGGAKKAGKTLILEEGMDYTPISMKPNELDLTNARKNTVSEVARLFNVPESMINSSANKYASNEQNNIYFLQYCISPIITSIESALDKSLLLEDEKANGFYFRFDVSELLRTTEKERIETTVTAMKNGLYSINEARAKIDMPNIGVDYFTWGLGSVFYNPSTGDMTIPNMGVTIDPNNLSPTVDPAQNVTQPTKKEPDKEELLIKKESDPKK
jgi:HK97 family phage portal protein